MPIALATCKGQPETVFADKACAHPAKLATMQQQDMHKDGQMARADKGKAGKKGSKAAKGIVS